MTSARVGQRKLTRAIFSSARSPAPTSSPVSVLVSAHQSPIEKTSELMTAAPEAQSLESRVGHYYPMEETYLVGREKVREYARAVQDYPPVHWDSAAAAQLGFSGLVA